MALTETEFKRLLGAKSLKLDRKGFLVALEGAKKLKADVALLATYLERVSES